MANKLKNPFKGFIVLLQELSRQNDNDNDEISQEELEQLQAIEEISAKNIGALEKSNGEQTMVVDENEDGKKTDRLGIKKPEKVEIRPIDEAHSTTKSTKDKEETERE